MSMSDTQKGLISKVATLVEWDFDVLSRLVTCAALQAEVPSDLMREISKYTTLLPEQQPLTVAELRAKMPRYDGPTVNVFTDGREELYSFVVSSKPGKEWEEKCLLLWPPRSKSDLALRRTRMADVWHAYRRAKLDWPRVVSQLAAFDYISVMNISLAALLCVKPDFDWWSVWTSFDAFVGGVEHYGVVAKFVNDQVKRHANVSFPRGMMAECGVLTGYRNPPFPGFDVFEQAKDLAEAGTLHGLERSSLAPEWVSAAHVALKVAPAAVPWVSLRDYVLKAGWLTSGASSDGRVEWEWGDEHGKFKARKNLVPEVVDLAALADRVEAARSQVNVTIIKAELGKIRLAVSSDLEMYLKMDYLMYYLNHAYKAWPGSTIEETVFEQARRQNDMFDHITENWNLPFDYRGFDHQASTAELQFMMSSLCGDCLHSIDPSHHREFLKVSVDVVESFSHSVLVARDSEEEREYHVTGGLMSGLRVTTLAGNAWNTVMTSLVEKYMRQLGCVDWTQRWIRGDDSAIVKRTYAETLLFRLCYAAINADGADGKFGIHWGCSEFLRVWYDVSGLQGYAIRAVPGLTQRKPWSPNPWTDEAVLVQLYDNVETLRRRGVADARLSWFWASVKQGWSRRKHVSSFWLQVPSPRGLGVEPWDGLTSVDRPWPRTKMEGFKITNSTGWTKRQVLEEYASWMPLLETEADFIADARIAGKVAGDDVPQINTVLRAHAVVPDRAVFKRQLVSFPSHFWELVKVQGNKLLRMGRRALEGYSKEVGGFGSYQHLRQKWIDIAEVLRIRGGSVLREFTNLVPEFATEVLKLERRGLSRTESVDWLFGTTTWNRTFSLHPMLAGILKDAVCEIMSKTLKLYNVRNVWRSLGARASSVCEKFLLCAELNTKMFSW